MFKFIKNSLKKYKIDFVLYIISIIIIWIISICMPYLTGIYIDKLVFGGELKFIYFFTFWILVLNLINILLKYLSDLKLTKLNTNIVFEISYQLYEKLKKVPLSFFNDIDSVYLINRINDDANVIAGFFTSNCVNVFINLLTLISSLIIIFFINKTISLISLLSIPIYIILFIKFKKSLYESNYDLSESKNQYFAKMTEQFTFIKYIKINILFNFTANILLSSFKNLFKNIIRNFYIEYFFYNIGATILIIFNVFVVFYGGILVIKGTISIGMFTIINVYFGMLFDSISYFLNLGNEYQQFIVSNDRLSNLDNQQIENNGTIILNDIEKITLNKINLYYKNNNYIIKDFSIEFIKGKIYTIIGANGVGKSSLVNLLIGLHNDLFNGEILYNNINIRDLDIYNLRYENIAVTEQEPILFNLNTYENITFGLKDNIDKEKLQKYINKFQIKNDIINKSITKMNLSGGEKQKISIIRSLLKNTPVIILDEPTSALDKKSITILKEILNELKSNKIIILITHDEDLLNVSDEIVKLEKI